MIFKISVAYGYDVQDHQEKSQYGRMAMKNLIFFFKFMHSLVLKSCSIDKLWIQRKV